MPDVIIFTIAVLAPFMYWRTLFYLSTKIFQKPYLRTKTDLQIHHIHYGIVIVLLASLILLFQGKNIFVIGLLGLGLGLILDESIAIMLMPGNRTLELEIYKKSFKSTA